jgi:predicted HicB family RNase H-like nuclease
MNDVMQYKNYYASVHFSATDEVFYGTVLGITDLVSFEGSSVNELKVAFEEAIDDYLLTCSEIGKQPEKTYKGTFNVRVPSALHKQASIFASVNNITLNEFVKKALFFALKSKHLVINQTIDNNTEALEIT